MSNANALLDNITTSVKVVVNFDMVCVVFSYGRDEICQRRTCEI
jgi:hypothetical protein